MRGVGGQLPGCPTRRNSCQLLFNYDPASVEATVNHFYSQDSCSYGYSFSSTSVTITTLWEKGYKGYRRSLDLKVLQATLNVSGEAQHFLNC